MITIGKILIYDVIKVEDLRLGKFEQIDHDWKNFII